MNIIKCLLNHADPFTYDRKEQFNFTTVTVAPFDLKCNMSRIPDIGLHEHQKFINECIIYGTKNFWDSFSQRKLKLSKTMVKKMKVALAEDIIEIKYDKKFFHM